MSELKHFDWEREATEQDDHEVIFLQEPSPERTWCCDEINADDQATDTAYIRADKVADLLLLLDRWKQSIDRPGGDSPYYESCSLLKHFGWAEDEAQ